MEVPVKIKIIYYLKFPIKKRFKGFRLKIIHFLVYFIEISKKLSIQALEKLIRPALRIPSVVRITCTSSKNIKM
jgi:hypothetical protein